MDVMNTRDYGLVLLAISILLGAAELCGREVPDSIRVEAEARYEAGRRLLDSGDVDAAAERYREALAIHPGHAPALVGVGHVHLSRGDLGAAEKAFLSARAKQRKYAPAHNGLGLVYLQKERGLQWAVQYFRDAIEADRGYAEAYYNMAEAFRQLRDTRELKMYRRLAEIAPEHPGIWFRIGRIYKDGRAGQYVDLGKAETAFRQQLRLEKDHLETRVHFGEVLKQLDKTDEAVDVLTPVVDRPNPFRRRALLELAEVHQARGEFDRAGELFEEYTGSLPPEDRALFYDLSLVATGDALARFQAAPQAEWEDLANAFWAGRDPAPITVANERLLEHYRRVAYAMEHYGEFEHPWDARGEVYIRYGRPDHVSRSDDIRLEQESRVVAVKERLINQAGAAISDLLEKRDLEMGGQWAGPDPLESVLPEVQAELLLEQVGDDDSGPGDAGGGHPAPEVGNMWGGADQEQFIRSAGSILGWPVYPVEGKVWEYWIYTDVGPGVEITFTQVLSRAPFRFADMPDGTVGHSNTLFTWQRMNPAVVLSRVASRTPDLYRPDFATSPLEFFFDVARFRGDSSQVLVEVYFGIPNWELSFVEGPSGEREARLVRGVSLHGGDNQLIRRNSAPLKLFADADLDTSHHAYIPEIALIPAYPGTYQLSVQLLDETSGRSQVYKQELRLLPFGEEYLRLSDVELAALIRPSAEGGKFAKGGVEVIPNPTRTYYPGQSVFIYYEIYNLKQDPFGATRYRVVYEVQSLDQVSVVARILSGLGHLLGVRQDTSEKVAIEYEHAGEAATDYGYLELDLSRSDPGEQILRIRIVDEVTGQSTEATTTFTIRR
jgi:GWxTD domain-containing protein